jgi:hypothetical protein
MTQDDSQQNSIDEGGQYPERWYPPQPEVIARPTYWPLVLSVGITLLAWGAVTSYPLSLLGLAMGAVALINWIGDIRRGQQHEVEGQ